MSAADDYRFRDSMTVKPSDAGLDSARRLEWLLPNGLGGYSSSTVLGLNTRKYHGLLVSSSGGLERMVVVSGLAEEIKAGNDSFTLPVSEYSDAVDSRGLYYLKRFTRAAEHARFEYDINGTTVVKLVHVYRGANAVVVSYALRNNWGGTFTFKIRPLLACRGIHEINLQGRESESRVLGGGFLAGRVGEDWALFKSAELSPTSEPTWYRNVRYSLEAERGEKSDEDLYSPGVLELKVPPYSRAECELYVTCARDLSDPKAAFRGLSESPYRVFEPSPVRILESAAGSFAVDADGQRSVIAGYHWFADWGRDTMISLPGLTLINGRLDDAESILARFIDSMQDGRIPTQFTAGGPVYYDYDGTLWMVDRLKEYVRYAGTERAAPFLTKRWQRIRSVVEGYTKIIEGGIVRNRAGTWMDTIPRDDAVEVQALWYNALNALEEMSDLVGDHLDHSKLKSEAEAAFMDKYWNGNYLRDCAGDDSIRPNQVIAASLDYTVVPDSAAKEVLRIARQELLTPAGLRTLDRRNPAYCPRYVGGVDERAKAYHNGTVWPWLIGPYAKASARLFGDSGRRHVRELVDGMFGRIADNCLGTLCELYDAEPPHTPRGAVSQAWSVAEILRAHHEDAKAGKS